MTKITTSIEDTVLKICPEENPVASNSQSFREEMSRLITSGDSSWESVELNLANVTMMDSSGIGVLIATFNSLRSQSISFSVTEASTDIAALLKSMGLHNHFPIE